MKICLFLLLIFRSAIGFSNSRVGQGNNVLTTTLFQSQPNTEASFLESQRQDLVELLTTIDNLQKDIEQIDQTTEKDELKMKIESVQKFEDSANKILLQLLPPAGLSMEEYKNSMRLFLDLPVPIRLALVKSIELEDDFARDFQKIPEIITTLYSERLTLTPKRLTDALKLSQSTVDPNEELKSPAEEIVADFYENGRDQMELENNVKTFLGRLTRRQENNPPTEKDLEIFVNALDSSTFIQKARPFEIPGGYAIRGQNKRATGAALIESLDKKLPKDYECSFSFMPDITATVDQGFGERGTAIILYRDDFLPATNVWFYRLSTLTALTTTLLFAFGVLGGNEVILSQLTDSTAVGDYSGLDIINEKVLEFLIPFFVILLSHEFGHYLVQRKENIQTTKVCLLPFWNSLPMLGSLTRLTSSPKNLTALFDYSVIGPLLGGISSLIFAGVGLMATKATLEGDSSAAELLPCLPVSVLKLSTLGGSVVDEFFGGEHFITSQDPSTPVPLHPFFIAGYCGLLTTAAEMLPLGATDGGRISLALFGRPGHSIIGGLTWLALLLASFSLTEQQQQLLVVAWFVNNIAQNDMEIPCRDETDTVNLPRVGLAFVLWFFAVLTLVPMA